MQSGHWNHRHSIPGKPEGKEPFKERSSKSSLQRVFFQNFSTRITLYRSFFPCPASRSKAKEISKQVFIRSPFHLNRAFHNSRLSLRDGGANYCQQRKSSPFPCVPLKVSVIIFVEYAIDTAVWPQKDLCIKKSRSRISTVVLFWEECKSVLASPTLP